MADNNYPFVPGQVPTPVVPSQQSRVTDYYRNLAAGSPSYTPITYSQPQSSGETSGRTQYYRPTAADPTAMADIPRPAAGSTTYSPQQDAYRRYYSQLTGELSGLDPNIAADMANSGYSSAEILAAIRSAPEIGSTGADGPSGYPGASPAMVSAMRELASSMSNQVNPYQGYGDILMGMYDPASINQRWDKTAADVTAAGQAGTARLQDIAGALQPRIAQAGQQISDAVAARQAALQQLAAENAAAQASDVGQMNQILSAADAGAVQAEAAPLQNLFTAAGSTLGDIGSLYGQSMADRQSIAQQLGTDVQTGMARDEAALLNQIAAQRAAQTSQMDSARKQLEAELYMQNLGWQNQQAQQRANMLMQAAQLGIDPAQLGL